MKLVYKTHSKKPILIFIFDTLPSIVHILKIYACIKFGINKLKFHFIFFVLYIFVYLLLINKENVCIVYDEFVFEEYEYLSIFYYVTTIFSLNLKSYI